MSMVDGFVHPITGFLRRRPARMAPVLSILAMTAAISVYHHSSPHVRPAPAVQQHPAKLSYTPPAPSPATDTVPSIKINWGIPAEPFTVTARRGNRQLWSALSDAHGALVVPEHHEILAMGASAHPNQARPVLVARSYSGTELWQVKTFETINQGACTGGDLILCGGTFGRCGVDGYFVANGEGGPPGLDALNLKTHHLLWHSNVGKVGTPIWTNGTVFISLWVDLSPRAIRRYTSSSDRLIPWVEEWRVRDRKLLWKRPLANCVLKADRLQHPHSVQIRFAPADVFSNSPWFDLGEITFGLSGVDVPVLEGSSQPDAMAPRNCSIPYPAFFDCA